MSEATLSQVAEVTGGRLYGQDVSFSGAGTDTRTIGRGQLFFALRGPNHDAHAFLPVAHDRGAAGAVVQRRQDIGLPQVEVREPREALGLWAGHWRSLFNPAVIAVTGSNGKTTVKEMIAAILRAQYPGSPDPVLSTRGNLNNDIGLPLTVLRLEPHHRAAVFELGASAVGDIAWLTGIARPAVGIVTNAGTAHLSGFGSQERIASGKGELFAGLPAGGTAVINRDDCFWPLWRDLAGSRRCWTFGEHAEADFRAVSRIASERRQEFEMLTPLGRCRVSLPMAGAHNVSNALAAAAAALAVGCTLDAVAAGLGGTGNVAGRLVPLPGRAGCELYDDSYNANPGSVRAAIEFLADLPGERWLVLGDMAELGSESERLHRETGSLAAERGIERLWCTGGESRAAVSAFGRNAAWFDSVEALAAALRDAVGPDIRILVKGSRSMGLERVVQGLKHVDGEG
ncbi:MAG: UDP-N-acetylmuramoyl-tripeptide--D-alanyl-D-alanine ligase [Chromatiales bacterium]|nr:UDP-N-acetylmuramoyl-tripeptide--D-alanyl-D-alanine ligase [Chromatiales bacterium]